jgi:uncharacterized protein (DUF433 family)
MSLKDLIVTDPEIFGGTPVFRGTRVPVAIVFDNLADGLGLEEVLESYPSLDRRDVVEVLKAAGKSVAAAAA